MGEINIENSKAREEERRQ